MKILALDQASNISGWAIFQDGKLDSYGKIDLHSITNVYERLHELKLQVKTLIHENQIEKVFLEDIYMDGQRVNNVQTFKILAEVFGVLYELCLDLKVPVEAILAGTWKSGSDAVVSGATALTKPVATSGNTGATAGDSAADTPSGDQFPIQGFQKATRFTCSLFCCIMSIN